MYDSYEISLPVYTGDPDDKTVKRKKKKIVIKPSSTKWIKKKVDPNCKPSDYDDCLVWFLQKIPGETVERVIVKKPSKTDKYVMETFTIHEFSYDNDAFVWREVLCADKVTEDIVIQIKETLYELGFLEEFSDEKFDKTFSDALHEFQRENDLPFGNLDFETLDALNIDY